MHCQTRKKDEAAHNLCNLNVNREMFLENDLFLSNYDIHNRREEVGVLDKKAQNPNSRGRGSLLTLLSKTYVNYLVSIIEKHCEITSKPGC